MDTLLLAEVFNELRQYILSWGNLDPDFYVGLPSLAYDIFLYKTKMKIELISDEDKLKFFEDAIRGGLSYASERLTDTRVTGKTLMHWDINNLYGE